MGNDDGGRRKDIVAGPMISMCLRVNDVANGQRSKFFDGILDRTAGDWGLASINKDDALSRYDYAAI